jgi:hypothetical protein
VDKEYLDHIETQRSDSNKEKNNINASSELICNDVE